jgi:glycosyltransferase involved in cell wall biosynthesis
MTDAPPAVREWRVLVAAPFPPCMEGRHGGSRALAQLLARMATRHSIALLVLKAPDDMGVDDVLRRACDVVEEVEIAPIGSSFPARLINRVRLRAALLRGTPTWAAERATAGFRARLEELVNDWQPDVIQFEFRIMGQFLPAIRAYPAPCLLVDLDPGGAETRRSGVLDRLEVRAWESLGRDVLTQVDSVVVLTERDRKTLSGLNGSTRLERIPLGYELPESPLDPAGTDPNSIVCVGSFIHPPNIDGAQWLARDIFPSVRARVPTASLQIVGSHAPSGMPALDGEGVTVSCDVPDVRPYLDAAGVVAAPIRMGGGMRVKVLEALASGKAIVATPLALEGLELTHGEHVLVAETDVEFADALVALLADAERRTAMAKAGRCWAEEHLAMESQVRAYETLYASLAKSRSTLAITGSA